MEWRTCLPRVVIFRPKAICAGQASRASGPQNISLRGGDGQKRKGVGRATPSGYLAFCLQHEASAYCGLEAESIKAATLDLSLVRSSLRRYIMCPAS